MIGRAAVLAIAALVTLGGAEACRRKPAPDVVPSTEEDPGVA